MIKSKEDLIIFIIEEITLKVKILKDKIQQKISF